MAIKLRRGLEIDRMPIVFAQGEIIYVIDTKKVYIGDGTTYGGNLVTGEELLTALDDVQISSLANNNLLSYNSSVSKWQNKAVTTTDISEGTNLYFTNERVDDRVAQMLLAGANVTLTYNDNANTLTIDAAGNVQSVNTKTGAVVLTTTDISEGTNEYHTSARVRAVILTGLSTAANAIISATDSVLSAFGKLQAQITANLSTLTSHTSNTSNPHSVTKAQVGLSNVDNTSDANKPISTATQTALDGKVDENAAITGATKTKITYDAKGLVTAGADATTADIADSTNRRYITDAQLVVVGNTSGTNTGDQTLSGLGGVPTSRTLTINGTTQDLSADRAFTIATGITIGTTPITLGTVGCVLFEGTGNVVSESANLFWDNTNARVGVGTSTPSAIIHSVGSVTASSLIARGAFLSNTLVASANNDVLVGLDIAPTFTNGTFTGVTNWGLRSTGLAQFKNTSGQLVFEVNDFTRVQSGISAIVYGNGSQGNLRIYSGQSTSVLTALYLNATSSGNSIDSGSTTLSFQTNSTTRLRLFNTTGNIGIGTTTDAGYKLDINGTARVSGNLTIGSYAEVINLPIYGSIQSSTAANVYLKFESNNVILSSQNGINLKTGNTNSGFSVCVNAGCVVGTGSETTMNGSAKLQVDSTTRGFLPPRMTTTQKNAIVTPAAGLQVYDTTLNVISLYNGTNWVNGIGDPNVRHDYVEPYSYVGTASQSSLEGSNVWKITRIQNLTDANVLITTALNVSWSNRLTHTYS